MANTKKKEIPAEVKETINVDKIKRELTDYVKKQVDSEVKDTLEKNNKMLLRNKTFIIVRRDIVIILLLFVIGYLGYNLYQTGYFNKYYKGDISAPKNEEKTPLEDPKKDEELVNTPSLSELKDKYSSLLNPLLIADSNSYLKDFYEGNLTNELKLSIVLSNIDSKKIEEEDGSSFIDEKTLKDTYQDIFLDTYQGSSFLYNGVSIKYSAIRGLYFANAKITLKGNGITREITNIVEDDFITITTIEYVKKENKIYNVLTKKEIPNYTDGEDIIKYKDSLNSVKYIFKKNNGNYYLSKLEV